MDIICVIPARYKSSRFPGKPLCDIHGKPMIWWVYKNASEVASFKEVYVATDDEKIMSICDKLQIRAIMTSSKHSTGTDRVAEVATKIPADLYVNVQGDEPMLKADTIEMAIKPYNLREREQNPVTNLMTPITEMSELVDCNIPKVVVNQFGEAVFLSRQPIPYPKESREINYMKQVCVYAFRPDALDAFKKLPQGPCEKAEGIELLRFIENNIKVQMIKVNKSTMAIDTLSDLKKVRMLMKDEAKNDR